jgi:predicted dehydrogenase
VPLGVGVVGSGFMGRTWSEVAARHVAATSLVAVAGGTRAARLAADYGVAHEPSLEALLDRDDVDVLVVTTPPNLHRQITLAAAACGKHLLVEKPMARDAAECAEMIAACDDAGVRLGVVSQHRFRDAPLAAKGLIADGVIGDVRMVRVTGSESWWDMTETKDEWKLDPEQQKIFADWGAHGCDVLRWLVDSRPVLAFAQYEQYGDDGPPDQSALALYRFASGVLAEVLMSFEIPAPGLGSAMQYLIIGSTGMIEFDAYGSVRLARGGEWSTVYEQPPFDPLDPVSSRRLVAYSRQLQDLVMAVEEGRDPLVSGREGLITQEMLDAAELSARSATAVALPLGAGGRGAAHGAALGGREGGR